MGPQAVEVAEVRVGRAALSRPSIGTVQPMVRSTLAAEEEGLVDERLFDEGQQVQQGAVLIRTNADLVRAQLAASGAVVEALKSQIEQATAERDRAKLEVERMRPVIEQRAAPQKELDDAERDYRVSVAILANRRATLAEKQADLQRMRIMLARSEVRSPFDGVISRRYVEVGQWVKQGDPVADVVQLNPLHVRTNVPENLVAQLRVGDAVAITIDALPERQFEGRIDRVLPEADPATRTFAVDVKLENPDGLIRPGFFARATFYSGSDEPALLVPRDAVVNRGTVSHVIAVREGKAVLAPIRIISGVGDIMAVRSEDLTAGETVVTKGNEALVGGEALMLPRGAGGPGGPPGGRPGAPVGGPSGPPATTTRPR
jgi:RND family efflux transporter MFP subunit